MASEKRILQALDLVTTARLSSLGAARKEAARQIRQILGSPNIVGIGVAEKISSTLGPTGKLALTFYVVRKRDSRKLKGAEMVPPVVPEILTGGRPILTDVVELGEPQPVKAAPPPDVGVKLRRDMQVSLEGSSRAGVVRDVHFRLLVDYDGSADVKFRQQVLTTPYGRPGRSLVVLDRRTGRPAGRHAALAPHGCLFDPAGSPATGKVPALDTPGR